MATIVEDSNSNNFERQSIGRDSRNSNPNQFSQEGKTRNVLTVTLIDLGMKAMTVTVKQYFRYVWAHMQ